MWLIFFWKDDTDWFGPEGVELLLPPHAESENADNTKADTARKHTDERTKDLAEERRLRCIVSWEA